LSIGYPPDQITYEWEFEGGNPSTSTEKNPVVQYNTHGVYDVKLTASIQPMASNTLTVEDYITVLEDVGISNGKKTIWNIMPNPTSGLVTVSVPPGSKAILILFDQVGREVVTQEVSNNSERINLSRLPKGLYFAELKSGDNTEVKKLVLQ
jgi:PKD repeat protein